MRVVLIVGEFAVQLIREETIHMATQFTVGQTLPMTIAFLDQNGHAMAVPSVPDAPPVWTNSDDAAATLAPAADGMSANVLGVAAGNDTVSLALSVGGMAFSATIDLAVAAVVQTLTSIAIVPGTPA